MKLLILGGTRFVGRHVAAAALAAGHAVTTFTRGRNPLPGTESLVGDRATGDYAALHGRAGGRPLHLRLDTVGVRGPP
jgi:nucleoside-diphosphate-sugar epimerase